MEEEEDLLLSFRCCVVPEKDSELKEKLKMSISFRQKVVKQQSIDFPQMFPFFFAKPDLVNLL